MTQHRRREFGDFQTPLALAHEVCALLMKRGIRPKSVLEPTCGCGSFRIAAIEQFSQLECVLGVDVNDDYVRQAASALASIRGSVSARVKSSDFFKMNWAHELSELPQPLLIIGNPPWVTNSTLGSIGSKNLPQKSNFQNHRGIEAITGKSNFDIAEWMLLKLMTCLNERSGALAMLCKTSTARKVLKYCWQNSYKLSEAVIYRIDAKKYFNAAVDACLLTTLFVGTTGPTECQTQSDLSNARPLSKFGLHDGQLIADLDSHKRWRHLFSPKQLRWRPGVKHDCSPVMELQCEDNCFCNGLREVVTIEDDYIYPMYKGTEISKGNLHLPSRWMVVPQRNVSEDTLALKEIAPRTWNYLIEHADLLDRRASSIYKKRPRFSIFGIGDYTFSKWKVAVSALHKRPRFTVIGTFRKKPIVLDDTCYLLPCKSRAHAQATTDTLNSSIAGDAILGFVFTDSKRPLTTDVLNQLNLPVIAKEAGLDEDAVQLLIRGSKVDPQGYLFKTEQDSAVSNSMGWGSF